jgi:predicted dehydrogenase/threonine dehydrogenase-like Zn-dependent dehydrogenase
MVSDILRLRASADLPLVRVQNRMKQVTQNYKSGDIKITEIIEPALRSGGVLVRTEFSVVSTGTEGMKVREGKLSYLGKARARPDQLLKVIGSVRQQGLLATYQKVMNKLDSLTPLGYSLAGTVTAVGTGAEEFRVGQRVACAGAGYANHAELNFVPKNLVVPIPDNVESRDAAFTTVGAIALQGFRQSELQLGETACIIGLGLLGQLLVQILRAAGVNVIGVDLLGSRCRLAESLGAQVAMVSGDSKLYGFVDRLTAGCGVDCVFIAAGGSTNAATELAVSIARDRARVVDIGKTRLDLPWNDYYMKELDVRFSRSYGPGRYDSTYEEGGIDYPIGYVRWTERRNLASFLDLVATGKVSIDPLISEIRPFGEAESVYQEMAQVGRDVIGVVFKYGTSSDTLTQKAALTRPALARLPSSGKLRLAVIGAGNYASSMLLPHLHRNKNVELVAVATTTGLSGQNAIRKFSFKHATTDYRELIADASIDAVLIATRHTTHAAIAAEALRAGKVTYVEKPLALSMPEVALLRRAIAESGNDRLMVGFNRRFSPAIREIAGRVADQRLPIMAAYRVHAGRLERGSWYLDASEGTRFAGEAGHFFDTLRYLTASTTVGVSATCLRPHNSTPDDLENIVVTVRYQNGSVGALLYLTQGGTMVPKEVLEVFGGGSTAQMFNFEELQFFDGSRRQRRSVQLDKGQKGELEAFVAAARANTTMPIPLEELFETTVATLAVAESLGTGKETVLAEYAARSNVF